MTIADNNSIQLPLYIQKYIIKTLCIYINKTCKLTDYIGDSSDDYRNLETEIKKLMITLALVNKEWLKTLSNNINVAVDFNYKEDDSNNNNKWSIIKEENIKTLKLHYDHEINIFYKKLGGPNGIEFPMDFEFVKNRIEKLSKSPSNTFKRLVLRNFNLDASSPIELDQIDFLYPCKVTENNLRLLEIPLNQFTTLESLKSLEIKVKKVFSLVFDNCYNQEVLLKALSTWVNTMTTIYISRHNRTNPFSLLDLISNYRREEEEEKINYLPNIQSIEINSMNFKICEINRLLKSCYNLTDLSINICYKNLLFLLSNEEERTKFDIKSCQCNFFVKGIDKDIANKEFKEQWSNLKEIFKNLKSLKHVLLNYDCPTFGGIFRWNKAIPLPDSFINEIGSLISSNSTIEEFIMMSCVTTQIFYEIVKSNKTITRFESSLVGNGDCDYKEYILELEYLLNQNQHIQEFRFVKNEHNPSINSYDENVLFDYKKSNNL